MALPRVTKGDAGLFMLGTSGAAGLFALFNPNFFTMIQKGVSSTPPTDDEIKATNLSMNIGLAVTTLNGIAIALANEKGLIPGIASAVTGAGLYLLYNFLLQEAIRPGVPAWAPEAKPPLGGEPIGDTFHKVQDIMSHYMERVPLF